MTTRRATDARDATIRVARRPRARRRRAIDTSTPVSRSHARDARALRRARARASRRAGDLPPPPDRGRRDRARRRVRRRSSPPTAARYGDRDIPMDDALVQCVLDLGGRAVLPRPACRAACTTTGCGRSPTTRGATLHLRVLRGRDRHHVVEAAFKALGLALRDALVETRRGVQHQGRVVDRGRALMLTRRVIVCLDVRGGRVVKGARFE